jgi:HAD superfamily hydrolase (TIGR01458 family)
MADPRTRPRALVLDMEGVLHVDWVALPGSPEAVRWFLAASIEVAVLTNTTGRTRAEIADRLGGLGIPVPAERIVTSASATAEHLRNATPTSRVFALAEPGVLAEFAGLDLVERPSEADTIVLGGPDARWTYPVLNDVFAALMRGAALVAMQRNRWWTTRAGPALDAGMFVAGLEYAAEVQATVIGKPSPAIFAAACALTGADPAEAMMVGDDLESDLRPAAQLGMATCLVRTGKGATFAPAPGEVDRQVADLAALADALGLDPA